MKRLVLLLATLLLGFNLAGKTAECKVVPSRLPLWEKQDFGSPIVGFLSPGTKVVCAVDDNTWVFISANGISGWTRKYGGVLYPWDPEYDTPYYDGVMFSCIAGTAAPRELKEYYRRKAGIAAPPAGQTLTGYDPGMARLSNQNIERALKAMAVGKSAPAADTAAEVWQDKDGDEAAEESGQGFAFDHWKIRQWLFWIMVGLLALCTLRALTMGDSENGLETTLLFLTGVVELAYITYTAVKSMDMFWFISNSFTLIWRILHYILATVLVSGQAYLFYRLCETRSDQGVIDGNSSGTFIFWAGGALLYGLGGFNLGNVFGWISIIGVPLAYLFIARDWLRNRETAGLGVLYIVTGLGFSCVGSRLMVLLVTGAIALVFFNALLDHDHTDLGKCKYCFWYRHFDDERHTGRCFPDAGSPNINERLRDVENTPREKCPYGNDGCNYFRKY